MKSGPIKTDGQFTIWGLLGAIFFMAVFVLVILGGVMAVGLGLQGKLG